MCRRLPDGTYRYCPSRKNQQRARTRQPYRTTGRGLRHSTATLSGPGVLDGVVAAATTGQRLHPDTVTEARALAAAPDEDLDGIDPAEHWRMWGDITRGSSMSAALTALRDTGWLQRYPELAALHGVPQDPHWHPEGDVLTHLGQAGDHMMRQCTSDGIDGEERTLLVLAATLHDLGKATHTHIAEDGRITSYGHDDAGVAPMHRFLVALDAPARFHDTIEPLIREHMCIAGAHTGPTPRLLARLARRLGPATVEQWVRVVNADHGGRGTASQDGYASAWLECWQSMPAPMEPLVTGQHLIAAGFTPGPQFRKMLAEARQSQVDGRILTAADARRWVSDWAADRAGIARSE